MNKKLVIAGVVMLLAILAGIFTLQTIDVENNMILVIVVILLLLGSLGFFIALALKKNDDEPKKKKPINYRAFLIIGISYIPIGISTKNYLFVAAGVIFMLAGLINYKKWKDYQEPKWSELSPKQKKVRIIVISFLGLMVLAGVATLFLAKNC
jgi:hypothetical protein